MGATMLSYILLVFILLSVDANSHIDFSVNPNCSKNCLVPWVIYGHRWTKEESTHYLYGAVDTPTFMMMTAPPNSSLSINWPALQNQEHGSLKLEGLHNLFGLSFQNVILFNDVNDTGTIDNIPPNQKLVLPMSDFEWNYKLPEGSNRTEYPIYISSNIYKGRVLANDAEISINLTIYTKTGRGQSLPHLLVSENSTLLDISLDDLVTALNETSLTSVISGFNRARCALDMMIFGSKAVTSFSVLSSKSLDDEHTPGIFSINDIVSQADTKDANGFLQWRPVAYLTEDRNINFATKPTFNKTLLPIDQAHLNGSRDSLVYYLFGNDTQDFSATQTIVSFGRPKDGFYKAYNYTLWSFSLGLGDPPREGFSATVIAIISIGIGIPALLLAFAILYWAVVRRRRV